jgi:hypothetical protein
MKSISEIYVSSFDGLVFKTTDGGIIWSSSLVNNGFILCGIGMIDNQLYALEPNNFHKQVDSFWMWQGSTGINCWSDFSVDPKDGSIYAGGVMYNHVFPAIAKTNTQGGNWQVFPLREDTGSVRELIFLNQGFDYAIGEIVLNQQALYGCIWSKNLNHSWEREYVSLQPTGMFGFLAICKTDHYIYVVGGNGIMIRKNILLSNISQHEIKNKYSLSQNYPNPFNPVTKIQYQLPKNLMVTIKVFDILGKEIQTLVNQNQIAGTNKVYFDGSNLSSGIYFYKITAGEFTETKKMILVK